MAEILVAEMNTSNARSPFLGVARIQGKGTSQLNSCYCNTKYFWNQPRESFALFEAFVDENDNYESCKVQDGQKERYDGYSTVVESTERHQRANHGAKGNVQKDDGSRYKNVFFVFDFAAHMVYNNTMFPG